MKIGAADTAMVGDSLRADVEASQALGMTAVWRRMRKDDPPHEPEQVGEGPSTTKRGATRAETGRALGEYSGGEGVTADYTIWTLKELTELPIFA
jgi:FMN phosphatase YigB (HAD superfamily)